MREVYVGNGKTICVEDSEHSKEYDWERLQNLLDSVGDSMEITVGMDEDWFFTAEPLTQENIDNKKIGGISGSTWATPSVEMNGLREPCYTIKK